VHRGALNRPAFGARSCALRESKTRVAAAAEDGNRDDFLPSANEYSRSEGREISGSFAGEKHHAGEQCMVLGWAVSNTMDVALCLTALARALQGVGGVFPRILNTDQGSQYTAQEWVAVLQEKGIAISMDGKGRWMNNVLIERLWRSVKYEDIYLREYATIDDLIAGLARWFFDYNEWRPRATFGGSTPAKI